MAIKLVKDVFEDYTDLKDVKELAENTINFLNTFMTKNPAHISFFGGGLLGSDPVRWTPSDSTLWLGEFLYIDEIKECQQELKELPGINAEYQVSSNIVNLSLIWAAHKIYSSNLKEPLRTNGMIAAVKAAQIKHLTGGLKDRFEHGTDPSIAMSLYESLDRKTDLKAQGNWSRALDKKAEVFLSAQDVFGDVFSTMDDDNRVILLANELYGRINKMLNVLTRKFYIIYNAQNSIKAGSKLSEVDGEKVLKNYTSQPRKLLMDMENISRDNNAFIKEDLVDATLSLVSTCSRVTLENTLKYYTVNFYADKKIREMQNEILLYMLTATRKDKVDTSDIPAVVRYIRNMFRSSGTQNKDVLSIKVELRRIAEKALGKSKENLIVSAQVALLLYIVLRALTVKAYS